MRTRKIPRDARHLPTYAELESYLRNFADGLYPFLWIVGRPGLGKSECLRAAMRGHRFYLCKSGQLTPAQFFVDCYEHRGEPIVLDDAEHLLDNKLGAKFISALGETSPAKQLDYQTTSRFLGDVPRSFLTTSPLCVIANHSTGHDCIRSRAVILFFDPTNLEIHRAVAGWFWDQEIHDWFGQHLYRLPPLDTRWYVTAFYDKRAGRDWRQIILLTHTPNRSTCIIQDLESDSVYPTKEEKALRFAELMGNADGASRATYFRHRRTLKAEGRLAMDVIPPILLRHTKPPGIPSLLELEAMEAPPVEQPTEPAQPLDLPARERFAEPIRGTSTPPAGPQRMILDDKLAWEKDQPEEDDAA